MLQDNRTHCYNIPETVLQYNIINAVRQKKEMLKDNRK
jgi:hypothetical protein